MSSAKRLAPWMVVLTLWGSARANELPEEALRTRLAQRVVALREARLLRPLNLPADRQEEALRIFRAHDAEALAVRQQRRAAHEQLKAALESGKTDDAELNRLLDQFQGFQVKLADVEGRRAEQLRRVLTPKEYGRMTLLAPAVHMEIQRMLVEALREGP